MSAAHVRNMRVGIARHKKHLKKISDEKLFHSCETPHHRDVRLDLPLGESMMLVRQGKLKSKIVFGVLLVVEK